MKFLSYRPINLYIFLFCASLLCIAYYMEHVMMLEPCPLCIMQRVFFFMAGFVALLAFLFNPAAGGRRIFSLVSAALSLAGGGFAIRQIYLQHLPKDEVPSCGPGLSYMIRNFPVSDWLKAMFTGDGNCAEIKWTDPVIHMSIPQWSLVGFVALALLCLFQAYRKRPT